VYLMAMTTLVALDSLEKDFSYYQDKVNFCFRTMKSRELALRATEALRGITRVIKRARLRRAG
jgi:hypothetical protein